jgi:signal transduction histidine kinase
VSAPARRLFKSSLALRIYLVGLAQFAVVALGFAVIVRRPPEPPHEAHARFIAAEVEAVVDDRDALDALLHRVDRELRTFVTLRDASDAVVLSSAPSDHPRCERGPRAGPPRFCFVAPSRIPGGKTGSIELSMIAPPPPVPFGVRIGAIVLFVVGVSSWLLARSLRTPLVKLKAAARAFGDGHLESRANLDRSDELGDVSRAFDEMATRVTELLRTEKELLANVSHELRTPLARIRVALDLAAEGDAEVAREALADITEDLDELERLISDILATARLDLARGAVGSSGSPPLRSEVVDVTALLERAIARFRSAHPTRALEISIAPDLPSIQGDPVLLRRVVDNVLENAHKYSDREDAPVELSAMVTDVVTIAIADHGIGVSQEDLPRLFQPFFRADRSRTRATGGLGLGLALAKRIVEAHGGAITIESQLDQGTRVCVTLPLTNAHEAAKQGS